MSGPDAFELDLASFGRHMRAIGRADGTIQGYAASLHRFRAFLERDGVRREPADVRPDDVRRFVGHLLGRNLSSSANQHSVAIRGFFRFLVAEGAIERSPAERIPVPRAHSTPAAVLDLDEITAILRACRGGRFIDR